MQKAILIEPQAGFLATQKVTPLAPKRCRHTARVNGVVEFMNKHSFNRFLAELRLELEDDGRGYGEARQQEHDQAVPASPGPRFLTGQADRRVVAPHSSCPK
jgi:hypothetical protein